MNKAMQFLLRGLLMTTMLFAVSAVAQDAHTTGQFQGPKANKGHVTHSTRDGKSVLTLSDDFIVPDTPDPHWQVVDSVLFTSTTRTVTRSPGLTTSRGSFTKCSLSRETCTRPS